MENRNEINIYHRITRLYVLALAIIIISLVLAQVIIQYTLARQTRYSEVINIAGRQRMLSQKICKDLLLVLSNNPVYTDQKSFYLHDLDKSIETWHKQHENLKNGFGELEIRFIAENSEQMKKMIAENDPTFYNTYRQVTAIQRILKSETPSYTSADSLMKGLLRAEKHFLEKQEVMVAQYETESKNRIENIKKLELLLFLLTLVVIVLEVLLIFRQITQKIKETIELFILEERKTKQLNEELNKNNATLKEIEKEKRRQQVNEQRVRSASLIQGQEEERKRISKELHDGLGQLLTTLKLSFENITPATFSSPKELASFNESKALLKETINEVRNISFNLMPSVLGDFGVASALKLLCEQTAKNTSKNIIFEDINWVRKRLDKNLEIGLYRIGQEALNNAVKYSGSDEIEIELELDDNIIELTITDYGKGFKRNDLEPIPDIIKNGISNMEERAKMIGGSVKIVSNKEEGTKVTARVPLKYADHE